MHCFQIAQSDENISSQSSLQTSSSLSSGEQVMESEENEGDVCDREKIEEKEEGESHSSQDTKEVNVDNTQRKGLKRKLDQESLDKVCKIPVS